MRHEPAGRVAARAPRVPLRLRLRAGEDGLVVLRPAHEGTAKLAGDALRPDAPTCSVDARLGEVRSRLREEGATYCVAVDAEGIVAGLVQGSALDAHPGYTIEQAMEFGVTTVRPSEKLGPLRERLKKRRRGGDRGDQL